MSETEHYDVVLVGAGISAVGLAHHLKEQCPGKSIVMLESKSTFGGTWRTHTYPGIRSDSDLYTFGYRFKPWTGAPIAQAHQILTYMEDVIEDDQLGQHIRYNTKITKAAWSSTDQRWTLTIAHSETGEESELTCSFFIWSGGYYDHDNPYTPDWPTLSQFSGEVIHPQKWPDKASLEGRRVVVIGSGATAATLIPNICEDAAHVTMLQRSPTYFWTGENRNELADRLRKLDLPEEWVHEIVRRDQLEIQREVQHGAAEFPDHVKQELLAVVRQYLGDELTEKHFTPSYRPWQQRLAYVPDGDLFEAVKSGKASIVTDHIDSFTKGGIRLKSGEHLEADVIITATGFNLSPVGGIDLEVDGNSVAPSDTFTYRGILLSGLPNFAMTFGYLRTSWTMRVDLIGDYLCRLLNHMDQNGARVVTPTLRSEDEGMTEGPWIAAEEFNAGYMTRELHRMPKTGGHEPWMFLNDYYIEKDQFPAFELDDGVLRYA